MLPRAAQVLPPWMVFIPFHPCGAEEASPPARSGSDPTGFMLFTQGEATKNAGTTELAAHVLVLLVLLLSQHSLRTAMNGSSITAPSHHSSFLNPSAWFLLPAADSRICVPSSTLLLASAVPINTASEDKNSASGAKGFLVAEVCPGALFHTEP